MALTDMDPGMTVNTLSETSVTSKAEKLSYVQKTEKELRAVGP